MQVKYIEEPKTKKRMLEIPCSVCGQRKKMLKLKKTYTAEVASSDTAFTIWTSLYICLSVPNPIQTKPQLNVSSSQIGCEPKKL